MSIKGFITKDGEVHRYSYNALDDIPEGFQGAVQSVNGKTGEVELTAEDVGAISQNDLQEATNEVLAQAKSSGEFDGEDGYTPVKGTDYFTEADKQEIARQAASLVELPETAMQPLTFTGAVEATYDGSKAVSVEIPQGGGGAEWELINDVTVDENVAAFTIGTDSDGKPFSLNEVFVTVQCVPNDDCNAHRKWLAFSADEVYGKRSGPELCTHPTTTTAYKLTDFVYAKNIGGQMLSMARWHSGNTTSLYNSAYAQVPSANLFDPEKVALYAPSAPCQAVKIIGYQDPIIGVGDRIIIWGVRA